MLKLWIPIFNCPHVCNLDVPRCLYLPSANQTWLENIPLRRFIFAMQLIRRVSSMISQILSHLSSQLYFSIYQIPVYPCGSLYIPINLYKIQKKKSYKSPEKSLKSLKIPLNLHPFTLRRLAGCFMVGEEIWSKRFATFEDYNGTKATRNSGNHLPWKDPPW